MADRALYYPYIHIHDVNWLKGTLLLFDRVLRMTPVIGIQPGDSNMILPFTQQQGGREPMVDSAPLFLPRVVQAQVELAERIREDAKDPEFVKRFDRAAAEAARGAGELGFQIHQGKLDERLKSALGETGLAWDPREREPYDGSLEYVELHPSVGEAVMATIAIACATGAGLDIVGDKRSGPLHECLTGKQQKEVYDALLKPKRHISDPQKPDARELFEFVVSIACDTSKLDAERLASMDREPIRNLTHALAERAEDMAAMDPGKDREKQFRDEASKIIRAWQEDRANMQNFWKEFFGYGLLEQGGKSLEKYVDHAAKLIPPATTGLTGVLAGLALHGPLVVASGIGLGIGLFTHAAKTYSGMSNRDRNSPYRYLTDMESAGVVIRTDLRHVPTEG